jgi:hypothetical protein
MQDLIKDLAYEGQVVEKLATRFLAMANLAAPEGRSVQALQGALYVMSEIVCSADHLKNLSRTLATAKTGADLDLGFTHPGDDD